MAFASARNPTYETAPEATLRMAVRALTIIPFALSASSATNTYAYQVSQNSKADRFWRGRGIRFKSLLAATLVMTAGLAVGGATVVLVLEQSLTNNVVASAKQHAIDIAAQVSAGGVDAAKPVLNTSPGDGILVQIANPDGKILLSSAAIEGEPSLIKVGSLLPGESKLSDRNLIDNISYAVSAQQANSADGTTSWVIVAQSLGQVSVTTTTVALIVFAASPLLVAAVGFVAWRATGQALMSVSAIRDRVESISHSKLNERIPVPMADDEISALARTMNNMLSRLEVSANAQRQFVADVSHELRSPLASIRASLDVAEKIGTSQAREMSSVIVNDEAKRMSLLVDDLLLLAKADAGQLGITYADVDLDDLLGAEINRLRGQTGLKIEAKIQPTRIRGDGLKLSQTIRNLLDNASRFALKGMRISLSVEHSSALLRIEDDGPGIAAEDRIKAVERFVRLDQHRSRDVGGTGLGLAIANEIILAHGGSMDLGVSDLGGLKVEIKIPTTPPREH